MIIKNNFKSNFIHSLISSSFFDSDENINFFLPTPILCTNETTENIMYIKAMGIMEVPNSFYYTQKNFHSYCIIYSLSGSGIFNYKKENHPLLPGSLLFINCLYEYSIRAQSDWNYQVIFFDGYPVPYYYSLFNESSFPVLYIPKKSPIPFLLNKLLQQSYIEKELVNAKLLTDILTQLVINPNKNSVFDSPLPAYLVQIKETFDINFDSTFSLDALATEHQVNKYRICREFKKYFGITPIQYLNNIRINAAKSLLENSTLSISEISYHVGFENVNHFIKQFKKDSGFTPTAYRKYNSY